MNRRFVTTVLLAMAAATGASQAPERTLVLDFYALGADGSPVADLKPEEVTVKVDGRARTVRALRLVKQASAPAADPLTPVTAPAEPFATNRAGETGRSFILVVEDESFRPGKERPIRSAVRAFLGALSPKDRVSLWTVPHGGIKVDLTANHDRLAAGLDLVNGHGPDQESRSDASCRTRFTLNALDEMLTSLTGGEGPTTVLLFTASMYGPGRDAAAMGPPGMCELRTDEFTRVGHSAAQARAHLYIIQPEDLQRRSTSAVDTIAGAGFAPTMNPLEGMEQLAAVTGGLRLSLTRLGDETLVNIARSTSTYYSVTVDGAASDNEGAHGLDVKASRSGIQVRSRPFVFVSKPGLIARTPEPAEMVRTGAQFPDLPLRVSGFASLNDRSGNMRLVAAAEAAEPGIVISAASVAYFDSSGKMVGQTNLTKEQLASAPLLATVVVPSGVYRVRVAAVDSTGRGGAADTEVEAEMTPAGTLKLSSLVLGLWRDNAFQPRLQFSTEPVAIAYLDVVGGVAGAAVAAFVEIARTANGPAIATTRLALESTSDPTRFTASAAVPIGGLPPGDYVVRAIVGIDGKAMGRVVRVLRKVGQ
jgi:VWFA-related protein